MKRTQFLLMTAAVAVLMVSVALFTACEKEEETKKDGTEQTDNTPKGDESKQLDKENDKQGEIPQGYVDLGLPSGTYWKEQSESGFYDYDSAVAQFGDELPTKEQLEELKESCEWQWTGSGYKVTGPNGNFITMPAAGYCNCNGVKYKVGSRGYYWSSTPNVSGGAWDLGFDLDQVGMSSDNRCYGLSVWLVQD